ncbi:uncharacterized protein [Panulirus ornatus]|uniref:uncharacterized protein n=1 Tax=Panulirus ornatus TaxID=150431 RepID=UPI003A88323D
MRELSGCRGLEESHHHLSQPRRSWNQHGLQQQCPGDDGRLHEPQGLGRRASPSLLHQEASYHVGQTGTAGDLYCGWVPDTGHTFPDDHASGPQALAEAVWDLAGGCLPTQTAVHGWPALGHDHHHHQPTGSWPGDPDHLPVQGHSPQRPCDLDHLPIPGQMSSTATLTGRKLKVYEWPPQSDPELEKKRMRAIKALRNRLRESQQEEELRMTLSRMDDEVRALTVEKEKRTLMVAQLQEQVESLLHAAP